MAKQDIRLQVFVTENMDNKLAELAEMMGLRKNEVVRTAIATYLVGMEQSKNVLREYADKQSASTELKGQVDLDEAMDAMKK